MIVQTNKQLQQMMLTLYHSPIVYYDTETTGLDPHSARLLLMSFADDDGNAWVVDCTIPELRLSVLAPIFQSNDILKVAHNATFDWKIIFQNLSVRINNAYCTMIGEQITRAGLLMPGEASLKAVAFRRLGVELSKDTRNEFINAPPDWRPEQEHFDYALEDARILRDLYHSQLKDIETFKLHKTVELDMSQIPIAANAEYRGVKYNREEANAIRLAAEPLLKAAEQTMQELFVANLDTDILFSDVDGMIAINTGSSDQMVRAFNALGVDVDSAEEKVLLEWDAAHGGTAAPDLSILQDPDMAQTLIDYQGVDNMYIRGRMYASQLRKLHSTYLVGFDKKVNPITTAIHFGLSVCGAHSTGRYSSSPNGQNIPKDDKLDRLGLKGMSIRGCFESRPGKVFVIVDLSGIELVILGAYSEDERLTALLPPDGDPHLFMANHLFKMDIPKKEKKNAPWRLYRDSAKTLNYAIPYGTTEYNLSRTLSRMLAPVNKHIDVDTARDFLAQWDDMFPTARLFLNKNAAFALKHGYTESINGRKRFWSESRRAKNSPRWMHRAVMREGQNHPIQSSSADILKLGMKYVYDAYEEINRKRRSDSAQLLLCVHDELVSEVDVDIAEEILAMKLELLSRAGAYFFPKYGRNIIAEGGISERYNK